MADPTPKALPDQYHELVSTSIDEKGIEIPHGLIIDDDDALTMIALAVPASQGYGFMLAQWVKLRGKEMIFAFDRFTREGQGTTLGDVMAGHYCTRAGTRPFIIEYQHAPRIVKPIQWDNAFWNSGLNSELLQHLRGTVSG